MTVRHPSDTNPLRAGALRAQNVSNYPIGKEDRHAPLNGVNWPVEGRVTTTFYSAGYQRTSGRSTGRSDSRDHFQDGGHDLDTHHSMQLNQTITSSIVKCTRNHPLVPFVPFAGKSEGNEINARRRSGNTVRSLRSLRLTEGTHVHAREHPTLYILLSERRERREQEGFAPPESCDYLVPFALSGEGNEGNEVVGHV